jgi:hypothetical protein
MKQENTTEVSKEPIYKKKKCTSYCGEYLLLSEFTETKTGYRAACKKCKSKREKVLAKGRKKKLYK